MSVRATERLIGDLVVVSALPNSPNMVVQAVDVETKIVVTTWFSDCKEYQEGYFPANALDRVDPEKIKKAASKPKSSKK